MTIYLFKKTHTKKKKQKKTIKHVDFPGFSMANREIPKQMALGRPPTKTWRRHHLTSMAEKFRVAIVTPRTIHRNLLESYCERWNISGWWFKPSW